MWVSYKLGQNQPTQKLRLARLLKFCTLRTLDFCTFHIGNNKCADHTSQMQRLVCALRGGLGFLERGFICVCGGGGVALQILSNFFLKYSMKMK